MRERNLEARKLGERRESDTPERPSVSGPMLVLLTTVVLSILTVGDALVLDTVFGRFQPLWVVILLCCETACIMAAMLAWPKLRPVARWHGLEILGAVAVGAVLLTHAIHLAPASLMPVSFSVDCSHQHLLVNYIHQHDAFPDDVEYLGFYDDYPVAPSALAALLAQAMGLLPVRTMYPLAALFVSAQSAMTYGILVELLPRHPRSQILAALAALLVFTVYQYSVGVFADRFYSNMMMGDLIILLALWLSVVRKSLHPLVSSSLTTLLAFGCLNSYPAWLPFLVIPFVVLTLVDQRLSIRWRLIHVSAGLTVTGLLAIVAVMDQWDFITWFTPSRGRALVPSWKSLGGASLILVGWGVWSVTQTWKHRPELVAFLLADLACVLGLYAAGAMNLVSLYIADKTFYFNVFVFIVLAGLGIDLIRDKLGFSWKERGQPDYLVVPLLGMSAVLLVNATFPPPNTYPITADEYRIAYQVAEAMPDLELTYLVRNGTVFYWMYGCILNHTDHLTERSDQWEADPPTYETWVSSEESPDQAIVSDVSTLPQDGRWQIILRSGDSAVIERVL